MFERKYQRVPRVLSRPATILFNLVSAGLLVLVCTRLCGGWRMGAFLGCAAAVALALSGCTRWFWLEMCAAFAHPDHTFNEKGAGRHRSGLGK